MTDRHGSFKTEIVPINVAGRHYSIERVAEIDSLLDKITPEQFLEDERLPYWAQLWASSIALAEYILRNKITADSFIELGSGLGLVSLAAAESFPSVACTDYESSALEFAERNVARNCSKSGGVRYELLDWRIPPAIGMFDVVAAADVLYEKRNIDPVLQFLVTHTKEFALIADPHRTTADRFFEMAEKHFEIELEEIDVTLDDVKTGVRICRLTPRQR